MTIPPPPAGYLAPFIRWRADPTSPENKMLREQAQANRPPAAAPEKSDRHAQIF